MSNEFANGIPDEVRAYFDTQYKAAQLGYRIAEMMFPPEKRPEQSRIEQCFFGTELAVKSLLEQHGEKFTGAVTFTLEDFRKMVAEEVKKAANHNDLVAQSKELLEQSRDLLVMERGEVDSWLLGPWSLERSREVFVKTKERTQLLVASIDSNPTMKARDLQLLFAHRDAMMKVMDDIVDDLGERPIRQSIGKYRSALDRRIASF